MEAIGIQSNFDGSNSSGLSVRVRPIHVFERYLTRQFSSWFMCMGCRFSIYSLFMDIHNSFMDIQNSFMDIHKSFMDIHNSFKDIHK